MEELEVVGGGDGGGGAMVVVVVNGRSWGLAPALTRAPVPVVAVGAVLLGASGDCLLCIRSEELRSINADRRFHHRRT